jgi:hypothetical protein
MGHLRLRFRSGCSFDRPLDVYVADCDRFGVVGIPMGWA